MNLYARLHAWTRSLFKPTEAALARDTYVEAETLLRQHRLHTEDGRDALVSAICKDVSGRLDARANLEIAAQVIKELLDSEEMFQLPRVDWSMRREISELWALRERAATQLRLLQDFRWIE